MKKTEPYGFIYITINMVNGKRYIGQKKLNNGWEKYLGSGTLFKKALFKYGKENFIRDIVAIAYSKEELDILETQWIENYNAVENNNFYNIAIGGGVVGLTSEDNGMYGKNHTDESKKKMSETKKEFFKEGKIIAWNKGKHTGNFKSKKIICLTTEIIFNSAKEGAEYYNVSPKNLPRHLKGERKSCGKLHDGTKLQWMYYDKYLKLNIKFTEAS